MKQMTNVIPTEELPPWLRAWKRRRRIRVADFLSARVVFYPGSGTDGQPVQFFGSRHLAHSFVLVDYGIPREHIEHELGESGHPFAGYARIGHSEVSQADLAHIHSPIQGMPVAIEPYAFVEVFERRVAFDRSHGPERLAVLFLGADGVAAYDWLFCRARARAPFAVVLQDHTWGGNYSVWGTGGSLEQFAMATGRLPDSLLVAKNTRAWTGYAPIQGAVADGGGMHGYRRQMWHRTGPSPTSELAEIQWGPVQRFSGQG